MSGVLEPGKVRQSGPQRGWVDPNFDHKELEPRAHAKKLLKITQQWKAAAEEGGIPPHDRFVGFLDAVTSLTTRMRDSEILQELGRIRALLSEHDRKHSDTISKMQHYRCPSYEDPSNRQTRQCPPDPPASYRFNECWEGWKAGRWPDFSLITKSQDKLGGIYSQMLSSRMR